MNPNLARLKPYPFQRLRALLANAAEPGASLIPLHIGEPKHAPPDFVIEALAAELPRQLTAYPLVGGLAEFRNATAAWLQRRYGLSDVDPDTMVIPVNGTREALFSLAQTVVDPGNQAVVVLPNPCYQIYEGAALLAGAEPCYLSLTANSGYQGDPGAGRIRISLVAPLQQCQEAAERIVDFVNSGWRYACGSN